MFWVIRRTIFTVGPSQTFADEKKVTDSMNPLRPAEARIYAKLGK
jgi:hypothetical protein